MGVTGLWTVLQPCARPVKIETLNRKRLAVDASIWIYQFLKAVRDKEGNALRNSHVVGFFRRICKLLFVGIKPVFVFDGGAPALKRTTIAGRKRRREGRREDAVRTAGKLLALQMQRRAEEDEQRRKDEAARPPVEDDEEPVPENLVYAEEVHMTETERQAQRKFKKKDQYHLPDLDVSLAEMGQPNDPRIMSMEELQDYAKQFEQGEDINVYDFSKIDFDSPFFISLPASDRYNILNAARLRSRLRMGYSKDQLDTMFPDRMAFSRFQIERVRERNELTQRLMNINGMNEGGMFGVSGASRVSGEKGREYVLVKNDGVEGGWALGVVSNKDEGKKDQPIDVDRPDKIQDDDEGWEDADEFEDVPIEGLNRLPKRPEPAKNSTSDLIARDLQRRRAFYKWQKGPVPRRRRGAVESQDPDSLFVQADSEEEEWEDVGMAGNTNAIQPSNDVQDEDEEELQRAIAMSLEQQDDVGKDINEDDDFGEVFGQKRAEEAKPFTSGNALAIARMANNRSRAAAAGPFGDDEDDNDMDFQAALMESRRAKPVPKVSPRPVSETTVATKQDEVTMTAKAAGFDGPLPFEKLDLGSSILGKKKMQKLQEDAAGGFEKEDDKTKKSESIPPWFEGRLQDDLARAREQALKEREKEKKDQNEAEEFSFESVPRLRNQVTRDVIDLEADDQPNEERYVIEIESSGEDEVPTKQTDNMVIDDAACMGDLADKGQFEPPSRNLREQPVSNPNESEELGGDVGDQSEGGEEELLEWEESDREDALPAEKLPKKLASVNITIDSHEADAESAESELEEFEDVTMTEVPPAGPAVPRSPSPEMEPQEPAEFTIQDVPMVDDLPEEEFYSDDAEEEELMRQLIAEEEEHARFTSSLNNKAPSTNLADYERELKQLRDQQKKDRRDADEVTQTMITECQQLLTLFGLPYITAPMEAEAQCAELLSLGLVDGIVTDDSDIFLFGGNRVYKNVFNQAKFVECYLANDLEAEYGLTRQRLISIAQLLGSDYTEGLPGIGPVTAVELISEFDDLKSFKQWWGDVQMGQRSKQDDVGSAFRKKFRRNASKLFLPPTFPDPRVDEAYLNPEIDSDPSEFVWGVPDLNALRSFLMSTIGWSAGRTDEILVPVIKDMNRREAEGTQSNITAFFEGGVGAGAFAPRRKVEGSKRLESALNRIGERAKRATAGDEGGDASVEEGSGDSPNGSKKSGKRSKAAVHSRESPDERDEDEEPRKKPRKTRTGKKNKRAMIES